MGGAFVAERIPSPTPHQHNKLSKCAAFAVLVCGTGSRKRFCFVLVRVGCCGRVENPHPTVRDKSQCIRTAFPAVCVGNLEFSPSGTSLGRDVNRYCCLGGDVFFSGVGEKGAGGR